MLRAVLSAALVVAFVGGVFAEEPVKIGLVQSLTGPFNTVGKAAVNGAQLYVQHHFMCCTSAHVKSGNANCAQL